MEGNVAYALAAAMEPAMVSFVSQSAVSAHEALEKTTVSSPLVAL